VDHLPVLLARHHDEEVRRAGQVGHLLDAVIEILQAIGPEPAWMVDAACRGRTDLMFPTHGQSAAPGKSLCMTCLVFDQCEAWGEEHRGQGGIIAGETERVRWRRPRRDVAA